MPHMHPEHLLTAAWLAAQVGKPGLAIVESDDDALLCGVNHIPDAVKIDWHNDPNNSHFRDYITGEPSSASPSIVSPCASPRAPAATPLLRPRETRLLSG
jgi:hypothetical protein